MEKEKYASYSFKIGSMIGGIVFLYHILMFHIAKDSPVLTRYIYMAIFIAGLAYAFVNYRRNIAVKPQVKFGRLMAIGTIVSLVVSLFYALFVAVKIYKLDLTFIQNSIDMMATQMENMGLDASLYQDDRMYSLMQLVFPFSSFIGDFVGSVLLSLILSFFVSRTNAALPDDYEDEQ
ncbi:MAG: DUF4199 domain-containing protein [Bacteroidales bacterium]|jgi:hypothetical protein|nr:DUF4199 domain-containing protein [Bacteroidales bacterium]